MISWTKLLWNMDSTKLPSMKVFYRGHLARG